MGSMDVARTAGIMQAETAQRRKSAATAAKTRRLEWLFLVQWDSSENWSDGGASDGAASNAFDKVPKPCPLAWILCKGIAQEEHGLRVLAWCKELTGLLCHQKGYGLGKTVDTWYATGNGS